MKVTDSIRLSYYGAGLSILAALTHGGVAPEHLSEWWGYGVFFALAGIGQGLYGLLLLLRPWRYDAKGDLLPDEGTQQARRFYRLGILGNAAIIFLYLVTRTIGIPFFGPEAGRIEPITFLSIISKVIELATIACLVLLLHQPVQETE
jgi:hypothetical protein